MTAYKGLGTTGNGFGVVTALDHKLSNAALVTKTTTPLVIRPGLFFAGVSSIISGTAGMAYSVAAFECVTQRSAGAGAVFGGNDGSLSVATTAAPGSNSRIDIIYLWHREFSLDGVDSNPVIGVVQGTAAAVPVAPSLAAFAGAIEIGRATVAAGAVATNGAGVTITQTAPFTSSDGGRVPFRTTTEMNLWTTALTGQTAVDLSSGIVYRWTGSAWIYTSHQESTLSVSVANTTVVNAGTFTADAGNTTETLYTGAAGVITFGAPGVYDVTIIAALGGSATGRTYIDAAFGAIVYRNGIAVGEDRGSLTIAGLYVPSVATTLTITFFQTTGGTRTITGRIIATRRN